MAGAAAAGDAGNSTIRRALIVLTSLALVALIASALAAGWLTQRTQLHTYWVNHTYQVELAVAETRGLVEQGETTRRGYLLAPGNPDFLAAYRATSQALGPAFARLRAMTGDNPRQRANVARLDRQLADLQRLRGASIATVSSGRDAEAVAAFRAELNGRRMRAIRDTFTAMSDEERRLLAVRDRELQGSVNAFYAVLGLAGVLLAVVVVATLLTILRYIRDLGASDQRLRALNETLEDQVDERTADLRLANEEIQRFAYIVSHDLRSPLVNVMGFTAELESATAAVAGLIDRAEAQAPQIVSEDARLAAREDLPEAIGFIRTSTQKMDRLINAILKLSREGRRVIAPEPIAVDAVVETIGGSLAHLLDERDATLVAQAPLPMLVSDRVAIEQVLSNLIENAVKYAQPGRPARITVSGSESGGRVHVAIADNGRGIAAHDHARVFDLFRRSGTQDQPGEGIGLAHVRAVVYRLGGTIDMTSELGQGSTFTIHLPKTYAEQDQRA